MVGFSAGITACMYVFRQVHAMIRESRQPERPRNGNGDHVKGVQFGQLTPEDVKGRMSELHHAYAETIMADMRNLMDARTGVLVKEVATPIVNEIKELRKDLAERERERRT